MLLCDLLSIYSIVFGLYHVYLCERCTDRSTTSIPGSLSHFLFFPRQGRQRGVSLETSLIGAAQLRSFHIAKTLSRPQAGIFPKQRPSCLVKTENLTDNMNYITPMQPVKPNTCICRLNIWIFNRFISAFECKIICLLFKDGRDKRFLMEKLFRYEMAYGKDVDDELYSSGSVRPKQLNHVDTTKKRDSLAPPDDLMLQVNSPRKRDSLAPPGDLMF